ncbi:MAG: hypothetical protein ACMUIL_01065 [bacterium]
MEQDSLFSELRRVELKKALTQIEEIQKRIEKELNKQGKTAENFDLLTGQRSAQEIMGPNMISVEAVSETFGVQFSIKQMTELMSNTYYEPTLQRCKDTHILFPGYPLTIFELSYIKPGLVICDRDCREGFWYDYKDLIYKDTPKCRWYLVRKNLLFNDAGPHIEENEEMLSPVEIIFMLVLYQHVMHTRLFSNAYLRCFKRDRLVGRHIISNAYIDTFRSAISIFHPFNHQTISPKAVVIAQKPSLSH